MWAHEVAQLERGCLLIETGELLPDVKLEVGPDHCPSMPSAAAIVAGDEHARGRP